MKNRLSFTKNRELVVKYLITLIAIVAFVSVYSCSENSSSEPDTPIVGDPALEIVDASDCKDFVGVMEEIDDCVYLSTDDENNLIVFRENACFNCCIEDVVSTIEVRGDSIIIDEKAYEPNPCDCLCLYDVTYKISNLSEGRYFFYLNEPRIPANNENMLEIMFDFDLKFSEDFSLEKCFERNGFYPWIKF